MPFIRSLLQQDSRKRIGRVALSFVLALFVLINVVWAVPNSGFWRDFRSNLTPVAQVSGLDTDMGIFAPNPITRNRDLEVIVTMADGEERVWKYDVNSYPIRGLRMKWDPLKLGYDRWGKVKIRVIHNPRVRASFVQWVVRQITAPSERPVRARLIMRSEWLLPPGKDGPVKKSVETLYDKKLTGRP